jgi:anti-anti-sigma factor
MPESPMTDVEHLPQAVVVHVLATELRKPEIDAVCAAIDAARGAAPASTPFILDMARVTFAGSLALGVLAGLSQEFRAREQRLVIVKLQPYVRQSVDVTQISKILDIMPDVPAALQHMGESAAGA